MRTLRRITALLLTALTMLATCAAPACAKTVEQWLEGYRTGKDWFGDETDYDITDEAACWELLQKPITVLDAGEREEIAPRVEPDGARVNSDKLGGTINGASAGVHVLGEDENGWTLIEGLDYYNRIIKGYVRTKLLKTVTPNDKYGIIIDKLTQRLYVFVDGKLWSSCAVSTGLPSDDQPYNETAAGEYLIISWVGGFDSEGMICEMALRFNGGDMIHQVPYNLLADGTKRFSKWEALLGQRASHGCVRTARIANEEGLNAQWLWDNVKKYTKVLVWDDGGRLLPYPSDSLEVFYNPQGGSYYHASAYCGGVKDKYLPLTAFTYGELDTDDFKKLEPCPHCVPAKRKAIIDEMNEARGLVVEREPAVDVSDESAADGAEDEPAEPDETVEDTEDDDVEVTIHIYDPSEDS